MTTPSSPPIDFGNLNGEFQQALGSSLLTFLRAPNGVVPNVAQNAHVPQNPPLSMLDLLNATRYTPFTYATRTSGGTTVSPGGPNSDIVPGSIIVDIVGGTNAVSCSWAYVGDPHQDLRYAVAGGGRVMNVEARVFRNSFAWCPFNLTMTDGVTNITVGVGINLEYYTS